jgi:2-phospho-L-lactate guanylyltransferase
VPTDGRAAWTVVIPVKGTVSSKSRLGATPELARAIALDSVAAAIGATDGRVLVVTSRAAAPAFGELGATVVPDPGGGLFAAIAAGIAAAGDGPVAVMLGDVPALLPRELADALDRALQHPLALVADADSEGTVLIAALDPSRHRPAFGGGSREAHLANGYVELEIALDSGLRRDVDTEAQLAALLAASRLGPRTAALL